METKEKSYNILTVQKEKLYCNSKGKIYNSKAFFVVYDILLYIQRSQYDKLTAAIQ